LLSVFILFILSFLKSHLDSPGENIAIAIGVTLLATLITIVGFVPFKRFVDHRILGITLLKQEIVEVYSARITTELNLETLVALLKDEILASLLIRQSALVEIHDDVLNVIYAHNVDTQQLPSYSDLPQLLAGAGYYQPLLKGSSPPLGWVYLTLVLSVEKKPIGIWLLGRRDPDDYYSPPEIKVLQSLAHQTAIALTNISQAGQLRALYQRDIDQREVERASLARELHDQVLNELAVLKSRLDGGEAALNPQDGFEKVINTLRQTISGLRPRMLDYGLYSALMSLTDTLQDRVGDSLKIKLELPEGNSDVRYAEQVELYTYRIVQQACENALKHGKPHTLTVRGELKASSFHLVIEDDGAGFALTGKDDLAKLQARNHFGLAGMYERASLIGSDLRIESSLGSGTRVIIDWRLSD
jgi:signal transduction histidine kinase